MATSVVTTYAEPYFGDRISVSDISGTSMMACEFSRGVVLGADSRVSSAAYVDNRAADKLTRITDHIYCSWSGAASYTQALTDIVVYQMNFIKVEVGDCPLVQTAAMIFRKLCYKYRDEIRAGVIVAGWDQRQGGQVYSVPLGGMVQRQAVSVEGSGAPYVYGYVDAYYRPHMTKEEAMEFVTNTLALAILRDSASGGDVRLGVITEAGAERSVVLDSQLPKFYDG